MLVRLFTKNIRNAFFKNEVYISSLIATYLNQKSSSDKAFVLDVGCGQGDMTKKLLSRIDPEVSITLYGIDGISSCKNKQITFTSIDLEKGIFPYQDGYFDVVYSNQVIEHILDKDTFLSESHRVLKKGGLFICSTENTASVDNIVSLLFGQEPLSQHTGSKYHTNSFLSPHFMQPMPPDEGNKYAHKNVCSYYGLLRLAKVNGFEDVKIKSFGNVCGLFEEIFPIYNRIVTIYASK